MRDEYSRQYIDDHGNVTGLNTERICRQGCEGQIPSFRLDCCA